MNGDTSTSPSWQDVLKSGVSGYIDSQIALNYAISDPRYNTEGGTGGQAQRTLATQTLVDTLTNPVSLILLAVAVGLTIFLLRR
jgi:hypothetical protein